MKSSSGNLIIEAAWLEPATRESLLALSSEQRHELRRFWLGRADGELTTALSFEYMASDLIALEAPPELTELAAQAIADEHRHVDWCLRFARVLGHGAEIQPGLGGTRPLRFEGASDADQRILRTVFGCCFSETVAVHVLLASQKLITQGSVARLNQQHIAEEVRHSRLGWALLAWPKLSDRDRAMLGEFVPEMTRLTWEAWSSPAREANTGLHELGYLSLPIVTSACETAFDQVIYPGLSRNGVRV